MKKTLELTLQQAQSSYKTADASLKEILEANFGKKNLIGRPLGVWCLTKDNRAVTAEENSFIVEAEGKKLRVSYDEFCGNHEDAMKFCKEHGGGDETVENLRFLAKHRDAINKELKKLDKDIIESWYWTNELSWRYGDCAFVVITHNGNVRIEARSALTSIARAVSAL